MQSRLILTALMLTGLVGCGSGSSTGRLPPVSTEGAPRFAAGPINNACSTHAGRRSSAAHCGCIQAAANLTLDASDQRRAVRFFGDPEALQKVKLSDTPEDERFWYVWARFAETAEGMCKGS